MTTLRFTGDLPPWAAVATAALVAAAAWMLYRRESHDLPGRLRWLLPSLRAAAFFLVVLIIAGPVWHHRLVVGQLGRVLFFLDASQSMNATDPNMPVERKLLVAQQQGWLAGSSLDRSLRDLPDDVSSQLAASGDADVSAALARFDERTRWRRAEGHLLDPASGLLARLARTHEVELFALGDAQPERLWNSAAARPLPAQFDRQPRGLSSDLGRGISRELTSRIRGRSVAKQAGPLDQPTAIVLITDGRHNQGPSPLLLSRTLGSRQIPIHTVGFGSQREPPDLALLELTHPDIVFQKDHVRGTLVLKDEMPPGQSFVVQISYGDQVLWKDQGTTQQASPRHMDFDFAIDKLVEKLHGELDRQVRYQSLPLCLRASITPLAGESDTANNEKEMYVTAVTQGHKLLLIDGRARWETRYLRNVFQRDEQWQVDTVLAGPGTDQATLPRGSGRNLFPPDEAALRGYDLIVLGELPAGLLTEHEQGWLRRFVEDRGGGLVFVDGLRSQLRQLPAEPLSPLLPVTWLPTEIREMPAQLRLTETGGRLSALLLESDAETNTRFWQELPAPHRMVAVQPLPGTEVLVEALVSGQAVPLLVTRSFGAGRVLYCAADETWRWRYKAADTYHQRFWNQVAKWIMERPYAVSDDYVSLDSGPASYASGQAAEIRVRLRGADGRPVTDAMLDALLWRDGQVAMTTHLQAESASPGVYRGRTPPLPEGRYELSVRATGFSAEALRARTQIVVLPPRNIELEQLSCNEALLREMASSSGGQFLPEEQIGQLSDLLAPLSSGYVVESDTVLWQSYWWFVPVVSLLACEWLLRKRAGLL